MRILTTVLHVSAVFGSSNKPKKGKVENPPQAKIFSTDRACQLVFPLSSDTNKEALESRTKNDCLDPKTTEKDISHDSELLKIAPVRVAPNARLELSEGGLKLSCSAALGYVSPGALPKDGIYNAGPVAEYLIPVNDPLSPVAYTESWNPAKRMRADSLDVVQVENSSSNKSVLGRVAHKYCVVLTARKVKALLELVRATRLSGPLLQDLIPSKPLPQILPSILSSGRRLESGVEVSKSESEIVFRRGECMMRFAALTDNSETPMLFTGEYFLERAINQFDPCIDILSNDQRTKPVVDVASAITTPGFYVGTPQVTRIDTGLIQVDCYGQSARIPIRQVFGSYIVPAASLFSPLWYHYLSEPQDIRNAVVFDVIGGGSFAVRVTQTFCANVAYKRSEILKNKMNEFGTRLGTPGQSFFN